MASKKTHPGGAPKRVSRKKPETPLIQLVRPQIFPIVGIGASAGGLEAFKQLLEHLPTDTGMAFIILQHLDPKRESILSELLSTATDMPVKEVTNDLRVEPDHVYVMPSNTNMTIARGVLRLEPREETRGRRRPIDYFLRSLADENGSRAFGVILSGTASDGALGLKAIKASSRSSCLTSSSDSARATCQARGASADWVWDCRWSNNWSSCTAERSGPRRSEERRVGKEG